MDENQTNPENATPQEDLSALQANLDECQDKYLRLLAESENARKRMVKEREELTKYAVERIIVEFLHPLDSFEKALKFAESSSDEVRNWAVGFEMILTQFRQVLISHGVMEYESMGQHFDPHLHDAVEVVETSDFANGTIVGEFLRGYKMGDRIIRVARVKVAKTKIEAENNNG